MLNIDFNKHPEIAKYIKDSIGKSHMQPNKMTIMDNETFFQIVENWIKKFEKDIDVMVENTLLVYELTNGQTGYQALSTQWSRWKGQIHNTFTKEDIRRSWENKFGACICHLYQNWLSKKNNTCTGGACGILINCGFTVELMESDLKSVKFNVVSDFHMSLDIENSQHDEIDMY